MMINNGIGKPSSDPRLFTISMIMNGITSSRLMSDGDLRVMNIQRLKRNDPQFALSSHCRQENRASDPLQGQPTSISASLKKRL